MIKVVDGKHTHRTHIATPKPVVPFRFFASPLSAWHCNYCFFPVSLPFSSSNESFFSSCISERQQILILFCFTTSYKLGGVAGREVSERERDQHRWTAFMARFNFQISSTQRMNEEQSFWTFQTTPSPTGRCFAVKSNKFPRLICDWFSDCFSPAFPTGYFKFKIINLLYLASWWIHSRAMGREKIKTQTLNNCPTSTARNMR